MTGVPSRIMFNICECPTVNFDDLQYKPGTRTPVDRLGFPQKCCGFIKLKCAAIIICIVSFFWAAFELQAADKFMASLFPTRGDVFYYCKMIYLLWIIGFCFACGVLLLGIIIGRYELVNVYVWYMFLFCCIYFIIIMVATLMKVLNTGSMSGKSTIRTVFSIIWTSFFIYFIIVVNSYKLALW